MKILAMALVLVHAAITRYDRRILSRYCVFCVRFRGENVNLNVHRGLFSFPYANVSPKTSNNLGISKVFEIMRRQLQKSLALVTPVCGYIIRLSYKSGVKKLESRSCLTVESACYLPPYESK